MTYYYPYFERLIGGTEFKPWLTKELAKVIDSDIRKGLDMDDYLNEEAFALAFMLQHFRNQERIKDLLSQVCRNTHFK